MTFTGLQASVPTEECLRCDVIEINLTDVELLMLKARLSVLLRLKPKFNLFNMNCITFVQIALGLDYKTLSPSNFLYYLRNRN